MQLTTDNQGDILIIHCQGNLDTSTATKTEMEINKHLKDSPKIVLDLAGTNFVSSAGLRVFLATAKRIMAANGVLRLCNANSVVSEILQISGFNTILTVKPTLQEALSSF